MLMETVIYPEKPFSSFRGSRKTQQGGRSPMGGLLSPSFSSFSGSYSQQPPLLPLPITRSVSRLPPDQEPIKSKPQNFRKKPKGMDQRKAGSSPHSKIRCPSNQKAVEIALDDLSGLIFSLSPHPSSLPLPKFSLRRKTQMGCNGEVSEGVGCGASDSLQRLLRLR